VGHHSPDHVFGVALLAVTTSLPALLPQYHMGDAGMRGVSVLAQLGVHSPARLLELPKTADQPQIVSGRSSSATDRDVFTDRESLDRPNREAILIGL
jgi:hypothetical protein